VSAPSDGLLARLFSRADHPIYVLDLASHRLRYANRCGGALLGYALDELLDMPASAVFRAERQALEAFLEAVSKHGDGWTTAFALQTKTGGPLPAELMAFPFHRAGRHYVLVLAITLSE
jgi:PAS domain S-box-containing protein